MRKIILAVLLLGICLPAFAGHKHKKQNKTGDEITSVTMHRTACFGRCPDYTIEINKDGKVTYTGIRFVTDSGVFTKDIGAKQASALLNEFQTYRVDTCKDMYNNRIPDLPGVVFTINYKDKVKTIRDAHFGPLFLRQLAGKMDEAGRKTDAIGWKQGK